MTTKTPKTTTKDPVSAKIDAAIANEDLPVLARLLAATNGETYKRILRAYTDAKKKAEDRALAHALKGL